MELCSFTSTLPFHHCSGSGGALAGLAMGSAVRVCTVVHYVQVCKEVRLPLHSEARRLKHTYRSAGRPSARNPFTCISVVFSLQCLTGVQYFGAGCL